MGTDVLRAWEWDGPVQADDAEGGLINHTWWVRGPDRSPKAVLQRLNTRIFRPEVHEDIEAVTARVAEQGLLTPRLIRTREGTLWHTDRDGDVYRCLTVVGERTIHKLSHPDEARSAARLLGRWHRAVRDLDWDFRMRRPGAHDTEAHFRRLREALEQHRGHRLYDEVAPLAEQILGGWSPAASPSLPLRVIHGDPKVANVRFVGTEAVAMVDLDTFARGTLEIELGDAMRSWCNAGTEGSPDSWFDLAIFEAAMRGYGEGAGSDGLTDAEWDAIVPGILRIGWELSSRFAQDALAEAYFGFDPAYGGRGEHNLLRARGQARLAASLRDQRTAADAVVARARRAS